MIEDNKEGREKTYLVSSRSRFEDEFFLWYREAIKRRHGQLKKMRTVDTCKLISYFPGEITVTVLAGMAAA